MTVIPPDPAPHVAHLRLVASDGQDVQLPHTALTAVQAPTLDELALAIAACCTMPIADALVVLDRARLALPREVAAVRSIFASCAELEAAGA